MDSVDAVLPQPAAASHANAHRIQSLGRCAGRRSRGRALPVAQATFGRASPAHTTRRVDRTSLVPDLFSHDTERDFTHDAHATALLTLEALKRRHLHRLCIRCGLTKRGQIRHRSSTSASGGVTQSDPNNWPINRPHIRHSTSASTRSTQRRTLSMVRSVCGTCARGPSAERPTVRRALGGVTIRPLAEVAAQVST